MTQAIHISTPERTGLREFGLLMGGIVVGLFGLGLPWLLETRYPYWPWALGGVLFFLAIVLPGTLGPVYRIWMRLGLVLNRITTPVILGIVYFLVVTPTGFGMRLFGRDPLARRFDSGAESYRVESRKAPREQMEKPF